MFELGAKDSGVAYLVRLRAHMTDRVGHSAIEVDVADNATGWFGHRGWKAVVWKGFG